VGSGSLTRVWVFFKLSSWFRAWPAIEGETTPQILRVGYAGARACGQGKFGILVILNSCFVLILDITGICLAEFTVRPRSDAGGSRAQRGISGLLYVKLICFLFIVSSQSNMFVLRDHSLIYIIFIVKFCSNR